MSAIVTGGTRGIGLGIARALVADGRRVTITGRDRRRVDDAMRQLGAAADRLAGEVVDVRDREAVDRLVAGAVSRFGKVDVLVNNAGVGAFVEVAEMTDDQWDAVLGTNLTGVFYCTRAAIHQMRAGGGGWIINIASLAGRNYFPGGAAYCASKAALIAFSEAVMQEVRFDDIRVSVVMPGSVATDFTGPSATGAAPWKLTPDDVAQVVMDLLRHSSRSLPSKVEIRPAKTR
jgi:NAD(P)-dependent dehydrogenase (short-subunit alcohol dehydrogenase family)